MKTIVDKKLGRVLTTPGKQAIYVWNKEPKGKVRCTGACAKAWPPVLVKTGVVVPMHVKGIMGEFGTVRRANGARQLTFNKRALYTYAHEKPGQVLCNNVDELVRGQGARDEGEGARRDPGRAARATAAAPFSR